MSADAYLSHLLDLLSLYERGPSTTVPIFAHHSEKTQAIEKAIHTLARRLYAAEEELADTRSVSTSAWVLADDSSSTPSSGGSADYAPSRPRRNTDQIGSTTHPLDIPSAPARSNDSAMQIDHEQPAAPMNQSSSQAYFCPTCGRPPGNPITMSRSGTSYPFSPSPNGSPLVIPPGPLTTAAFESGMSAVEELQLLKAQVQDVARVCKAVAAGDLTKKITVPVQGTVMVQLKDVINTMVDSLAQFAAEVTRVSIEVGTEGKLGGQAVVADVEGTWRELTEVVNKLADNLTRQVRSIAEVTTAVARGDLSKQIEVDASGEILDLKTTVNGMVVRLRNLAAEVTRVSLEVGTEGKLGGQAVVADVEGVWHDLTTNVNRMCINLTNQVRGIAKVTTAVAKGDLTQQVEIDVEGEMRELKDTVNSMVAQLSTFASEVTRVALEVGTMGVLGGQAKVEGVQGTWEELTNNVNRMANNLTNQVRSIAAVTKAVATGDLSKVIEVETQGEMLDLKKTVNSMVQQLAVLANEVIRVSLEVGMEGKLGGQAQVAGVEGMWKDLVDSVNQMATNLTTQVRSIAAVTKAVAEGDLSKRIDVDVRGEILDLKTTVNGMTESLSVFAQEVTRVAREVGTEGRLGGQARVDNVGGTWKDLTDNVNTMAQNVRLLCAKWLNTRLTILAR
ncbi:hypothetical protein FRC02_000876 [Tulasnella sp. 418]|nr:hypothetical protein FRC02_000876 [Tulasnella sp. 418]